MIRQAVIILSLMLLIPISSYAWQNDFKAGTEIFSDSDESRSFTFDQIFHWKNDKTKFGIGATETLINETGRSRSFYGGLIEGYKKFGHADMSGKLKLLNWDGKFKAPFALASSQTLGRFRFEESLDFSTIDSVKAYDAHIDYWSAGGSLDYSILKNLSITGGFWRRWSSDDNERNLFLGRLVYDLSDKYHAQYRYKSIRNQEKVPEYFSPKTFDQHVLLFGYFNSFFDKFRLKVWVGPVLQYEGFEENLGALGDVSITWKIANAWLLEGRIEANHIGAGYQYVYSTISITCDF